MRSRLPTCTSGRSRRGTSAAASCALVRPDSLTNPGATVAGAIGFTLGRFQLKPVEKPAGDALPGTTPDAQPCELKPSVRNVRLLAATLSRTPNLLSQFWLISRLARGSTSSEEV